MKSKIITKYVFIIMLSVFVLYSCGNEEENSPSSQTKTKSEVKETKKADTQNDAISTEPKKEVTKKSQKEMGSVSEIPNPYIVKEGDTLASIAEKFYNDSGKWFYIFAENEDDIDNWNKIYSGQKLILPNNINESEH